MTKREAPINIEPSFISTTEPAMTNGFKNGIANEEHAASNGHHHHADLKAMQNNNNHPVYLFKQRHINSPHRTAAPATLPFIIGVAGGTASGKTSVCNRIMRELAQDSLGVHERRVAIISADSFYKALTPAEMLVASEGKFNFDHPDALDAAQIVSTVKTLKRGQKVEIPVYDFVHHRPDPHKTETVYPAAVVIVEGILIFHFRELRELFHMKLFVDLDADVRLARRVLRDSAERGRELRGILRQYTTFVKPAFEDFCLPTKTYADIIVPRGAENDIAIELICQHIRNFLAIDGRKNENGGVEKSKNDGEA